MVLKTRPFRDLEGVYMVMLEKDGSPMPDDKYSIHSVTDANSYGENLKIEGCLLVAPEDAYTITMVVTEKYESGLSVVERQVTPVIIEYPPRGFEAGNQYRVKLKIKGANDIHASVDMEPWGKGGKLNLDFENDKPEIIF